MWFRQASLLGIFLAAPACQGGGERMAGLGPAIAPHVRAVGSSALLFDRRPNPYHASEFAARSDWPSTDGYLDLGEVDTYHLYSYDYQYDNGHGSSNPYRRFVTHRVGSAFR